MPWMLTAPALLYLATAVLASASAALAWRHREAVGGRSIVGMMVCVAWWAGFGAVELAAIEPPAKIFWSVMAYPGCLLGPVCLLFFAFELQQLTWWLHPARLGALLVIPALAFALTVTNGWHFLIWSDFRPDPAGSNLLVYGHGPAFWVVVIGYSYLCLIVATHLLAVASLRLARGHQWRAAGLFASILLPWSGNAAYVFHWSPWPVDLAPIGMALSSVLFWWVLVRSQLTDLIPLARHRLIEVLPEGVLVLDAGGRLLESNPRARRWLGLPDQIRTGLPLASWLPADPVWQKLLTVSDDAPVDLRLPGPPVQHLVVQAVTLPCPGAEPIEGRLLLLRDLTQRAQAEESRLDLERRLLRAEKNESLGLFAAGLVHDFNNQLTALLGRLTLLELKLPRDSATAQDTRAALAATERIAQRMRQLTDYTGMTFNAFTAVDLPAAARNAFGQVQSRLTATARVEWSVPSALPAMLGDRPQLENACVNLFLNAIEALPSGAGRITITLWPEPSSGPAHPPVEWIDDAPAAGAWLMLEIADTGHGMDAATRARMFEPFFSTKFLGRGLGLAAVWGIVHGHRGCIGVAAAPGEGTRVRLAFPVARPV